MHDIKYIRENATAFDAALARRGAEALSETILALDTKKRAIQTELQLGLARRNEASKAIGAAMGKGDSAAADFTLTGGGKPGSTGGAGPTGGSPQKPVGTVCFSWVCRDGRIATSTEHFRGAREDVRAQSVEHALDGVIERINQPSGGVFA